MQGCKPHPSQVTEVYLVSMGTCISHPGVCLCADILPLGQGVEVLQSNTFPTNFAFLSQPTELYNDFISKIRKHVQNITLAMPSLYFTSVILNFIYAILENGTHPNRNTRMINCIKQTCKKNFFPQRQCITVMLQYIGKIMRCPMMK